MQLSLRANLLAAMVPAREKWGFPKHLSKELHSSVINRRVVMPERPTCWRDSSVSPTPWESRF